MSFSLRAAKSYTYRNENCQEAKVYHKTTGAIGRAAGCHPSSSTAACCPGPSACLRSDELLRTAHAALISSVEAEDAAQGTMKSSTSLSHA